MGLYIFKYCVNMPQSEIDNLVNINVEQRIQRANYASKIFGTIGHGAPVTDNVFIIKANNYRQCMDLIDIHRGMIESSAWQRGTFGEFDLCTGVQRTDVLSNKLHMISQENSRGFKDVILCYKVTDEVKDRIHFFDAMAWAKSCKEASIGYCDLGVYKENLVYKK